MGPRAFPRRSASVALMRANSPVTVAGTAAASTLIAGQSAFPFALPRREDRHKEGAFNRKGPKRASELIFALKARTGLKGGTSNRSAMVRRCAEGATAPGVRLAETVLARFSYAKGSASSKSETTNPAEIAMYSMSIFFSPCVVPPLSCGSDIPSQGRGQIARRARLPMVSKI